ncbi:hypothetical protein GI374_12180 [Paracoccus sp. S-4012]|uniref:hypothetical protein n=1 Tax=Paracoccus sp. S-4012 TaxID=2665648 RepID=UPI0012B1426A|nr:hypothetical protein [Paracoccus sp. S-4012]MRX51193.1 hypothetical protein [Paracoccus sp. S-4012]
MNDPLHSSAIEAPNAVDLAEMLGWREAAEEWGGDEEATPLDIPWQDAISTRAYDFIVTWETGGRAYYEQVIRARPVWPAFASGITIGCGYDLGYHTRAEFEADWGTRLPRAAIERLSRVIGFRTDDPGRAAKVTRAKALVRSLSDIVVPWDVAIAQFDAAKMPKLVGQLYGALDNLDRLHPHARGALLSLVFNRGGGGFTSTKDRFREMRDTRRMMADGDFDAIPGCLRAMIRIWGAESSLAKRRRQEADLFEAGLAEMALTEGLAALGALETLEAPASPAAEDHEDVAEQTDDHLEALDAPELESVTEAPGQSLADVRWNPNDDEQPDYRHLPKLPQGTEFDLTAEDLEALIRANAFQVLPGRVLFALRGARLSGAEKREDVAAITLVDQRPDHHDFRCVIGVLDRGSGRLWAFRASTVPEAKALVNGVAKARSGQFEGNVLPTGCYTYTVGTHRAGTSGEIRGVLRLSKSRDGASRVIALRTLDDVVYDRRDFWHDCAPADNIHPGRRRQGFSSLGCMTLPGDYDRGRRLHTGLWADLREALGMGRTFAASDDGQQFSAMLLTGLDAALASRQRTSGEAASLQRLRFGSQGDAVDRLQRQLGLAPDASQLVGPVTRAALIQHQQRKLGWADGILSPEAEAELGLTVFN